jgi:solute carrier family 25 protein 14/30
LGRIAPALLRQASYGTIKIGIYQSLKRLFVERLEGQYAQLSFEIILQGIVEIMLSVKCLSSYVGSP